MTEYIALIVAGVGFGVAFVAYQKVSALRSDIGQLSHRVDAAAREARSHIEVVAQTSRNALTVAVNTDARLDKLADYAGAVYVQPRAVSIGGSFEPKDC